MTFTGFSDAALVLAGHGSSEDPAAGAPVLLQAAALRGRGVFAAVREGFWKQEPRLDQVLAGLAAPRVFIVPMFASEGYFSDRVIPEALGFAAGGGQIRCRQARPGQAWHYCRAVGTHPGMADVVVRRAQGVLRDFPFPRAPRPSEVTVCVAGHGTEQHDNSRSGVLQAVEAIRRRDLFGAVHGVFLDEAPRVPECFDLAPTRNLVVVPFFISDGPHVSVDIPLLLGEAEAVLRRRREEGRPTWRNPTEKKGKLIWYAASLGAEPCLADVILERVAEAAARPPEPPRPAPGGDQRDKR